MKGPAPLPPELARLRGRRHRAAAPEPPQAVSGRLAVPQHLADAERAVWASVVSAMTAMRTVGIENAGLLERYAVSLCRWRDAERHLAAEGIMLQAARTKTARISPWLGISRAEADRCLKMEAELGITPSSRSRATTVSTEAEAPSDGWAKLRAMQLGS